jgi:hypothetical protein
VPPDILKKSFTFFLPFDSHEKYQKRKKPEEKGRENINFPPPRTQRN